jgi:hypothetical protein
MEADHAEDPVVSLTALWEGRRLDLTVERLVLCDGVRSLFSPQELLRAKRRLGMYATDG